MRKTIAILLSDGYKQVHAEQFPKGLTKAVSYGTPRMSRLKTQKEMAWYGIVAFCKEYLIDYFNENFFELPEEYVVRECERTLDYMLGKGNYGIEKIRDLHKLGYLPIEVNSLSEGTMVPMGVPCVEVTNTHEDFAWVTQWVESLLSSEIWKPCIHAGVGKSYRKIVNKYYDLTVNDDVDRSCAISDFGFRGMSCLQEAVKASSAWLMSFSKTATIPAIPYLEEVYSTSCVVENIGKSGVSTEHSVMASNFSVDGDEVTFVRKLLTETYRDSSFSMVSDTYDYWNMIDVVLPSLKKEIQDHNGVLYVRPDSGDIFEVSVETVKKLMDHFGYYLNKKGYKCLNPKIGVIYGDGVTQERAEKIYKTLMDNGIAASCISFGAGSFSFNAIEEDGVLKPYTRDTFSFAIKATYGIVNGQEIEIFKDPKTDNFSGGGFKKSQKGMCVVYKDGDSIRYKDGVMKKEAEEMKDVNLFVNIFKDGKINLDNVGSISSVREKLNEDIGGF